jgi:hypothetical protein
VETADVGAKVLDVSGAAQAITPSNRARAATNERDLRKSTDRLERLPGTTPILTASIVSDSQQEELRPVWRYRWDYPLLTSYSLECSKARAELPMR